LKFMQQRYCDPLCGCFLSVDPTTAYDNGDMRFFNRYAYAFNNPYKFNDPDGRETGAAFRIVNNMTNGRPVTPPPRSAQDKLGPALGVALGAVAAAPVAGAVGVGVAVDMAMGDALGGASLAGGGVTLYRVVDSLELDSIKKVGEFLPAPNGDTVKRFPG
jgi:hypothetical protein